MKKFLLAFVTVILLGSTTRAQTTVLDFNQYDCNGQYHNLYSELDSGYVVIMEFIMTCPSCVLAGHALETIITELDAQYPGKIRFYQFAYSNAYDCSIMESWRDSNSFQTTVFEENPHEIASLGGSGMPTIGIAAGSNHALIYSSVGFNLPDTVLIGSAMRNYFATISSNPLPPSVASINTYPNPAGDYLSVKINLKENSKISLSLYDMNGRLVLEPVSEKMAVNKFDYSIDVSGLPEGNYMLKISVNGGSCFERVVVGR